VSTIQLNIEGLAMKEHSLDYFLSFNVLIAALNNSVNDVNVTPYVIPQVS